MDKRQAEDMGGRLFCEGLIGSCSVTAPGIVRAATCSLPEDHAEGGVVALEKAPRSL